MMPTPALYTGPLAKLLFTEAPANVRTPPLDLLFITDRAPTRPDEPEPYTADRSRSMAFGSTTILFGEGMTWDALVKQSRGLAADSDGPQAWPDEGTRALPGHTLCGCRDTRGADARSGAVDAHEAANRALQAEIARRLALSPRKEMVLYIHGVKNTFSEAAFTMSEMCHFLGREFVCAIFTWPAGGKHGILFGYQEDYESSTFAVEHLRKAIRTIADTPGLERIHILAHSRGTDVLATALSELSFESYMQQTTLPRRIKLGNVVLLAPDLDVEVAPEKILAIISDPDVPYGTTPNSHAAFLALRPFHQPFTFRPTTRPSPRRAGYSVASPDWDASILRY